jgi:PAS domain S-box-containing protein
VVTTRIAGIRWGLASALLSWLILVWRFVPQHGAIDLDRDTLITTVAFLAIAATVGLLFERERRTREAAFRALRERELARSERDRLERTVQIALAGSQVGIWRWDAANDRLWWSPEVAALHGMTADEAPEELRDYVAHVHRDDRVRLERALRSAADEGVDTEVEFRAVRADDTVRWLWMSVHVLPAAPGEPADLVGVFTDVHERHERERREHQARKEAQRSASRLELLHAVAARLAGAATSATIGSAVLEEILPALGAAGGWIGLRDEEAGAVVAIASEGYDNMAAGLLARFPVTGSTLAAEVARSGEPMWFSSRAEYAARFPELASALPGFAARCGIPLIAEGRALGALILSYRRDVLFPREIRDELLTVGQMTAQALERARLYQAERETAITLQRSILPARLPSIDRCAIAARYLPGTVGIAVGGDWYDVFAPRKDQVALCVGDVEGRGVTAAAVMAELRSAARAYGVDGASPAEVLRRLDRVASVEEGRVFATACFVTLDQRTGGCMYASAGHLPPLLLPADGPPRFLDDALSPPVGVGLLAEDDVVEREIVLRPDDTLVLYTDGLVERRDEPLTDRLESLRALAGASSSSFPDELADQLVRSLVGEEPEDDTAVLVLRLTRSASTQMRLSVPSDPAELSQIRTEVRRFLHDMGADEEAVQDLVLACSELCANAIEHPIGPMRGEVEVVGERLDDEVSFTVRDTGMWRPIRDRAGRGLGLDLVRQLVDRVEVGEGREGSSVAIRRRLGAWT